jgi:hypothetical protein
MNLPHQMNFLVIAIPGVIAALAIFMVNLQASVEASTQGQSPNSIRKLSKIQRIKPIFKDLTLPQNFKFPGPDAQHEG